MAISQTAEFVHPDIHTLSGPIIRRAARGLVAADDAFLEIRQRVAHATGASDPGRFMPSRSWFDHELKRLTPRDQLLPGSSSGDPESAAPPHALILRSLLVSAGADGDVRIATVSERTGRILVAVEEGSDGLEGAWAHAINAALETIDGAPVSISMPAEHSEVSRALQDRFRPETVRFVPRRSASPRTPSAPVPEILS